MTAPLPPLWSPVALAAATGGRLDGAWSQGAYAAGPQSVHIDTRDAEPGALFVALAGDNRDGHAFIAAAASGGAAGAIATRRPDDVAADFPLLLVSDTLQALERLGVAARARAEAARTDFRALAVTGSVGKTSTKAMMAAALEGQAPVHAAVRSFNNHWGVPLTLARMAADTRVGIFEIGMNNPSEIAPLAAMVRPHAALITAVAPVHIAAFDDGLRGVAAEKASIFTGLEPGGAAIFAADAAHPEILSQAAAESGAATVWRYGEVGEALDARLLDARLLGAAPDGARQIVDAEILGEPLRFALAAPGRHFALNALGALLMAVSAGASAADAAAALESWRPVSGRGDRETLETPDGPLLLVDESYNANPASLAAALDAFASAEPPAPSGRRLAFLTDMLELGAEGAALHAALADHPALSAVDAVHTAGPLMAALNAALPAAKRGVHAPEAAALAAQIGALAAAGDAVMVKGSLGSDAKRIAAAFRALAAQSPRDGGRP